MQPHHSLGTARVGWGQYILRSLSVYGVPIGSFSSVTRCPGQRRPRGLRQPEKIPLQEVNGSQRAVTAVVTSSPRNDQPNGTTARDRRDDPTSARHASPSNRQSSLPSPRSTDIGGGTAVEDRPHPPGPPASASRGRMDTSEPAPQSGYLDFLDAPEYLTASLDFAEKETARKSVTSMETTTLNSIETTVTAVEDLNGHDTYPTHLYS